MDKPPNRSDASQKYRPAKPGAAAKFLRGSGPTIRRAHLLLLTLLAAATAIHGCAAPSPPTDATRLAPDLDRSRAFARLDDIEPPPTLPEAVDTAPAAPNPQAARHLENGRNRFDEGLWADAALAFEKALQIDPRSATARLFLARTQLQQGNSDSAKSHIERVLDENPRDVAAHQLLGEIAFQQRDLAAAIHEFRLALLAGREEPRRPECVLARLSLALALHESGYENAAAEQLEVYIAATEESTPEMDAHRELREVMALYRGKAPALLGEIQSRLGRYDQAVEAYRRAAVERPDDPQHTERLILALARAGRSAEALERARDRALKIADDESAIDFLAGVCTELNSPDALDAELETVAGQTDRRSLRIAIARRLMDRAGRDRAEKIVTALLTSNPEDVEALQLRAELEFRRGACEAGIETLVRCLTLDELTYRNVMGELLRLKLPADCDLMSAVGRVAERSPKDPAPQFILAILSMSKDPGGEAAVTHCRRALKLNAAFAPAMVLMAMTSHDRQDWEETIRAADAAIEHGVRDAMIYRLKGEAHDALDEHEKAEAALLEAFRLNRKDAEPLFVLAQAAERRGQTARCEKLYRRILDDVDPKFTKARERLVRLLINSRNADKAREYVEDFTRLGQKSAAQARCRALLDLATSTLRDGRERLRGYQEQLRAIAREYPNDAATHLALAMSYEAADDIEHALVETEAALALDPEDSSVLERAADYRSRRLDFEGAVAAVQRLLRTRPRDLGYLQQRVRLALAQGDFDAAVETLRRILARDDPAEVKSAFVANLVAVLRSAGRTEECLETARTWWQQDRDDDDRRNLYLSALRSVERFDEAVNLVKKWLAEEPEDKELRRELIEQLVAADRLTEAQQWLIAWLEAEPDDRPMTRLLVFLFFQGRDWDSAIETIQTTMEDPLNREEFEELLALGYRFAGRFDDAVEIYRRRKARAVRYMRGLVDTLVDAERFTEAEKELTAVLNPTAPAAQSPELAEVSNLMECRRDLARIFLLTNRPQQAFQQYEEIVSLLEKMGEMSPGSPRVREDLVGMNNDLGYTYVDFGGPLEKAEKMIRSALGEQPINPAFIDSLAWAYYKRGEFDEAVRLLQRAVSLSQRRDAVMYDHLADALYRAGRPDEARPNWEKALELTKPDRYPPPIVEDRRTHASVRRKLRQLDADQPVETAPLASKANPTKKATEAATDSP